MRERGRRWAPRALACVRALPRAWHPAGHPMPVPDGRKKRRLTCRAPASAVRSSAQSPAAAGGGKAAGRGAVVCVWWVVGGWGSDTRCPSDARCPSDTRCCIFGYCQPLAAGAAGCSCRDCRPLQHRLPPPGWAHRDGEACGKKQEGWCNSASVLHPISIPCSGRTAAASHARHASQCRTGALVPSKHQHAVRPPRPMQHPPTVDQHQRGKVATRQKLEKSAEAVHHEANAHGGQDGAKGDLRTF